jgi:hypothetical protein
VKVGWIAGARIDDSEVDKLEERMAAKSRAKGELRGKES